MPYGKTVAMINYISNVNNGLQILPSYFCNDLFLKLLKYQACFFLG